MFKISFLLLFYLTANVFTLKQDDQNPCVKLTCTCVSREEASHIIVSCPNEAVNKCYENVECKINDDKCAFIQSDELTKCLEAASSTNITPNLTSRVRSNGCYVSGCSGQICSDKPNVITTCEYRDIYKCYKLSRCTRSSSGQCQWEKNPSFLNCLRRYS